MTLGQKIQNLRKEKGLSQEDLASQITVSRQAVSKWELDLTIPDTENIVQLSKILSVSTDYLLSDVLEKEESKEKETDPVKKKYNNKRIVLWVFIIATSIWLGFYFNRGATTILFLSIIFIITVFILAIWLLIRLWKNKF
ncbi:MAG: helix-turn-helix transcriptional regulator [Tissierellia bacterium]|jgi:transcriptional regulator with XRE-family HTH domain|nr:helix-turn-helix transcriptional regulator [Tissierellia bacterium]